MEAVITTVTQLYTYTHRLTVNKVKHERINQLESTEQFQAIHKNFIKNNNQWMH